MKLGANVAYDLDLARLDETVGLLHVLGADQVLIASHESPEAYRRLASAFPRAMFHVRLKGTRTWWPDTPFDSREWASEPTPRESIEFLRSHGITPHVVLWNEPDLELPPDWRADTPDERERAWTQYRDLAALAIASARRSWGSEVPLALAPLSAGNPERFAWWLAKYVEGGLLDACDFVAEHCYVPDGTDFDDPNWGGRWRAWQPFGKPIHVLETNANGPWSDRMTAYLAHLQESGAIAAVSLFTLPGGKSDQHKPAWWFLSPDALAAVPIALQPAPIPEVIPVTYTEADVLQATKDAAAEAGIPRILLVALGVAESGLRADAERWAYRDANGRHVNLTEEAKAAIEAGDHSALAGVIHTITGAGSDDLSFGAFQRTYRWAEDLDGNPQFQGYTVENLLGFREREFNPYEQARHAARLLAGYWRQHGDVLEALSRYNKPSIPASQNANRANYERGIRRALELLGPGAVPEPEAPAGYQPRIFQDPGFVAGTFARTPRGYVLHGSRSGRAGNPLQAEFDGTRNWARVNPLGLGWMATIGHDMISLHYSAQQWGYHAAAASDDWIGVEFAQATANDEITDGQVRAFVWLHKTKVAPVWPDMPLDLKTHAEVEANGEAGRYYGKSDVFPLNDPRADELRGRILAALEATPEPTEAEMQELQKLRDEVAALRTVNHHITTYISQAIRHELEKLPTATEEEELDIINAALAAVNTLEAHKAA